VVCLFSTALSSLATFALTLLNTTRRGDAGRKGAMSEAATRVQTFRIRIRTVVLFLPLLVPSVCVLGQQPKVLTGVVVDHQMGANWDGVVFVSGGRKYFVQLSSNNGDVTKYNAVPKVGDRVSVTYRRLKDYYDGAVVLDAIRLNVLPATARAAPGRQKFYLGVSRADCCNYPARRWRELARALSRQGVPAFFADWQSLPDLTPRGDWMVAKIRRSGAAGVDALFVGPFDSKSAAVEALGKIPLIWPDDGYGRWRVTEEHPSSWSIGMYSIRGYQAK
jgi:hypothetical protein